MIKITIAVLLAVAAGTAVAQQAEFVAGMLSTVPSGYALASLADLQSADFLNQYNSVGINYVQPFASGALCCAVSVQEGFLSIGPSDSYSNYLQPFLNGAATCTSGSQPTDTTFGIPLSAFGPYEGMWISNLTTKEQAGFRVTGVTPTGANFNECGFSEAATTAIFRAISPQYIVQIVGTGFPVPSGYAVAALADLQSANFQTVYNKAGGVVMTASDTANYCCILSVAEGWLGYNDTAAGISPLGVFSESFNEVECGIGQDRQLVYIGTSFGGPSTGLVFDTFNTSVTSLLGTFPPQNSTFCQGVPASQTLLKRVSTSHHKYIVQVVGTNYPAPPTSQYTVASIADVQSQDFLDFYNTNGGLMLSALDATNSICCIVQVAEGWLNYNIAPDSGFSPLSVYTEPGNQVECFADMAAQKVHLGAAFGGPDSGTIFQTISNITSMYFTTFTSSNSHQQWCNGLTATQTLLKSAN